MNRKDRTKFVSDVDVTPEHVKARKPFRVTADKERRRYVRLEISAPMSLRRIKDIFGNFWPTEQDFFVEGTILNISSGGVLVDVEQPLNEGDIVAMRFRLQDCEDVNDVLGLVKRSEQDQESYLSGIEFVTRDNLRDFLTTAELDLLGTSFDDFRQCVQKVLSRYLYTEDEPGDE